MTEIKISLKDVYLFSYLSMHRNISQLKQSPQKLHRFSDVIFPAPSDHDLQNAQGLEKKKNSIDTTIRLIVKVELSSLSRGLLSTVW